VVRFHVGVRVGGREHAHMSTVGVSESAQSESVRDARVELPSAAPGDPSIADPGNFPMYGVHTDRVVQLIATCGGELLQKPVDQSCGRGWISYRYVVRKPIVRAS